MRLPEGGERVHDTKHLVQQEQETLEHSHEQVCHIPGLSLTSRGRSHTVCWTGERRFVMIAVGSMTAG